MQKIKDIDHEISQAEFHLNQDRPHPRSVGLAIGMFLVMAAAKSAGAATSGSMPMTAIVTPMTAIVTPITAIAPATSLVQPAPMPPSCSMHLKNVQFAGTFSLKSTSGAPSAQDGKDAKNSAKMRFVIGQPSGGAPGSSVAQIWSGDRCQASCSSLDLEKTTAEDTLADSIPISLDLQCRGEELGQLSAHVAVLWDHGPRPSTVLRFGSWLEGYEQATMKVEVDHFNSMNLASRADHDIPPIKPRTLAVSQ